MPEQYTYLVVDFCCIFFPFVFSFISPFNFVRQWRYFLLPCIVSGLFFVLWDILFTYLGVWSFEQRFVIGINLFGLPIEEYFFFVCIPYACTFTYHCLSLFFTFSASRSARIFTWLLVSFLTITALTHLQQLYTSVTFLLLALFLTFLIQKKVTFLPAFFVCFALILLPFFISNGILTGGMINRTVVMYNNNYNLGIRMFTIPFEDTFYGMLLLLMNVAGFEWMRSRKSVV